MKKIYLICIIFFSFGMITFIHGQGLSQIESNFLKLIGSNRIKVFSGKNLVDLKTPQPYDLWTPLTVEIYFDEIIDQSSQSKVLEDIIENKIFELSLYSKVKTVQINISSKDFIWGNSIGKKDSILILKIPFHLLKSKFDEIKQSDNTASGVITIVHNQSYFSLSDTKTVEVEKDLFKTFSLYYFNGTKDELLDLPKENNQFIFPFSGSNDQNIRINASGNDKYLLKFVIKNVVMDTTSLTNVKLDLFNNLSIIPRALPIAMDYHHNIISVNMMIFDVESKELIKNREIFLSRNQNNVIFNNFYTTSIDQAILAKEPIYNDDILITPKPTSDLSFIDDKYSLKLVIWPDQTTYARCKNIIDEDALKTIGFYTLNEATLRFDKSFTIRNIIYLLEKEVQNKSSIFNGIYNQIIAGETVHASLILFRDSKMATGIYGADRKDFTLNHAIIGKIVEILKAGSFYQQYMDKANNLKDGKIQNDVIPYITDLKLVYRVNEKDLFNDSRIEDEDISLSYSIKSGLPQKAKFNEYQPIDNINGAGLIFKANYKLKSEINGQLIKEQTVYEHSFVLVDMTNIYLILEDEKHQRIGKRQVSFVGTPHVPKFLAKEGNDMKTFTEDDKQYFSIVSEDPLVQSLIKTDKLYYDFRVQTVSNGSQNDFENIGNTHYSLSTLKVFIKRLNIEEWKSYQIAIKRYEDEQGLVAQFRFQKFYLYAFRKDYYTESIKPTIQFLAISESEAKGSFGTGVGFCLSWIPTNVKGRFTVDLIFNPSVQYFLGSISKDNPSSDFKLLGIGFQNYFLWGTVCVGTAFRSGEAPLY